jgi:hypothetical protein
MRFSPGEQVPETVPEEYFTEECTAVNVEESFVLGAR